MEVHPPHGPIRSVKEFLVHLLAITIGLLIALGLEASVESVHHRRLVREARENIFQEIRDNERNVARELNALPTEKSYLRKTLDAVDEPWSGRETESSEDFNWTSVLMLDYRGYGKSGGSPSEHGLIRHPSYALRLHLRVHHSAIPAT